METELREMRAQTTEEIQTLEDQNNELQTQLNGLQNCQNMDERKETEEKNA